MSATATATKPCCSSCAETGGSCSDKAPTAGDMIPHLAAKTKPLSVTYSSLAPGMTGILQTLPKMELLTKQAVLDPRVRRVAEFWSRGTKTGDRVAEAHAIYNHVAQRLDFRRDPRDMQLLQGPLVLLERIERHGWAAGNCAAHAMIHAAIGTTIRLPIVWVLAGFEMDEPEHVYAAMRVDGKDVNAPVDDVLRDLLALDTGQPAGRVPGFGRHVQAHCYRVTPALRGL